ncbi:MAG: hypothetical protein HW414_951 [Dehalococcoidia bacterium]|nr:hypothetical protein [Dehalococcoidia bacterium]
MVSLSEACWMRRALPGGHEARAQHHSFCAQRQGGYQAAGVADAPGSDERYLQPVGGLGDENERGHAVGARVSPRFEAHDGDGIHAQPLGGEGVPYSGYLVKELSASVSYLLQVGFRAAPGGLDDLHSFLQGHGEVLPVVHLAGGGKEGDVDPEGPGGEVPRLPDLLPQLLAVGEGQSGQDAQSTRVGDGGHQLRSGEPLHGPLQDGMLDAQQLGDTGR